MHLLPVDSKFWICTSTEAQNQPHFPENDVLLSADPSSSFEPSFVDFAEYHFFLYSATMVAIMLFVIFCIICQISLNSLNNIVQYRVCANFHIHRRILITVAS